MNLELIFFLGSTLAIALLAWRLHVAERQIRELHASIAVTDQNVQNQFGMFVTAFGGYLEDVGGAYVARGLPNLPDEGVGFKPKIVRNGPVNLAAYRRQLEEQRRDDQ